MSRAGLLWLEGLALVSGAATLPSKKSQCSEEPTKPHREVFKQMGPRAAGHHETQSHFSVVSEGSGLFSSGELFSPSPQMLGVCSPEMLWHICPGFKSPLSTPCQCSHTAMCPPCCWRNPLPSPSSLFARSLSLRSRLVALLQTPRHAAKLSTRLAVPSFPAAGSCQAALTAWGKGDPL